MYTSEIIKYASIKAGITDLWQDTLESDTSNKVIKILCNFLDNIDMDVQRSFGFTYTDIVPNNDMLFISNESVSGNPVSACQILDEPCKQTPMIYCNNTELQQIYFPQMMLFKQSTSGTPNYYSVSRTYNRLIINFEKSVNVPVRVVYVPAIVKPKKTNDILQIPESHKSYIIAGLALEIAIAFQMPGDKLQSLQQNYEKELGLVRSMILQDKHDVIMDCGFDRFY